MIRARALRTAAVLSVLGANAGVWVLVSACTHDWGAYDPRIGSEADASEDSSTDPDASTDARPDSDAAMEADAPDPHVTEGILVLYDFERAGDGTIVRDVSGVLPALDLAIENPNAVTWIPGALSVEMGTIASTGDAGATKVYEGCTATNEVTLEVWFRPSSPDAGGPARILSHSVNTLLRNFTIGQEYLSYYQVRFRTTGYEDAGYDVNGGLQGYPTVETPHDDGDVTTMGLTHLLFVREANGNRRLYINGVLRGSDMLGGDLSNWDPTYGLALANEFTMDRVWLGELHRVAIYNRALTEPEVLQNHEAGP